MLTKCLIVVILAVAVVAEDSKVYKNQSQGYQSVTDNCNYFILSEAYIRQCSRSDPEITNCLKGALHHLRPYLATGIEEIQVGHLNLIMNLFKLFPNPPSISHPPTYSKMPSVEPFIMDHLQLQLTGGPQGYRVHLKNMEIYGASNFTVENLKLSENDKPFEARITIPKLNIKAKYSSTGVLIIIPASGSGDFSAIFDGVVASVRGTVRLDKRDAGTFMQVDTLDLELVVKKVRMHVSKIFNNSKLLSE